MKKFFVLSAICIASFSLLKGMEEEQPSETTEKSKTEALTEALENQLIIPIGGSLFDQLNKEDKKTGELYFPGSNQIFKAGTQSLAELGKILFSGFAAKHNQQLNIARQAEKKDHIEKLAKPQNGNIDTDQREAFATCVDALIVFEKSNPGKVQALKPIIEYSRANQQELFTQKLNTTIITKADTSDELATKAQTIFKNLLKAIKGGSYNENLKDDVEKLKQTFQEEYSKELEKKEPLLTQKNGKIFGAGVALMGFVWFVCQKMEWLK